MHTEILHNFHKWGQLCVKERWYYKTTQANWILKKILFATDCILIEASSVDNLKPLDVSSVNTVLLL